MTSPPVIADAGPLIGLARIGRLPLLPKLYGTAVIPLQVLEELRTAEGRPGSEALEQALDSGWLQPEAVRPTGELAALLLALGPGEAEAIVLAQQRPCRFLLLDEKRGRAVAARRGIPIAGTGTVLIAAKEKGLLSDVSDTLDRLAEGGYRLSSVLRAEILRMAGESDPSAP